MSNVVYLDTKSILVSTSKGLKRLNVPFLVIVCKEIDNLKIGDKPTVDLVSFTEKDNLLYYIGKNYYKYSFFVIIDTRLD